MYAILDDQSNTSLARSNFFEMFDIRSGEIPYTLSSCAGQVLISGRRGNNFVVESLDGSASLNLPTVVECNQIPDIREEIPTPEVALHHPHLNDIARHIPPVSNDSEILLLIGRDVTEAHHIMDQRIGPRNTPYAQKLRLGWVVIGETCLGGAHKPQRVSVNKTWILNNGRPSFLEPCHNALNVKETFIDENDALWSHRKIEEFGTTVFETTKEDNTPGMSVEDRAFLEMIDRDFIKHPGGNWTAPLPFRNPRPRLPNNRVQAMNRALTLDNSLRRNATKKQHMVTFMQGILEKQHAELAPPLEKDEECWYLPIFGVYHPKKPDQIRGVFDSSAQYEGVSLNNVLLSGPDLTNSLLGILLRFRKEPIAITADIQQMFHCFMVREDHRNFLRFLWYEDNNPDKDLVDYRMRVHVFGNSPSPAVATYGIRRAAQAGEDAFGSDVKEFVENNFYVDDALTSLPTAARTIDLLTRTQQTLQAEGNLRLHKIASNSQEVMEVFPLDDRAKELKDLDLGTDVLPLQRSLGLYWDLESDSFTIRVSTELKPYTRRGILSTVNSLYDPLGFVSPVLIQGKIILKDLMSETVGWDETLPIERQTEWEVWRDSLKLLESLQVPRTYVDMSLQDSVRKEIHVYCDASERAISSVAYLKTMDVEGNPHVGFILGKTKISPPHGHTIPRLELCSAVLAVEIAETVCDHLDISVDLVKFHTDSKIVLGYIYNQSRRFYVYVGNRVQRIRQSTRPEQWGYIPTEQNPADVATRSIPAHKMQNSKWLSGPDHLLSSEQLEAESTFPLANVELDKEVKPQVVPLATEVHVQQHYPLGSHRFERFSSWRRLANTVAFLKHIGHAFHHKGKCKGWHTCSTYRNVDAYIEAERCIIHAVQEDVYAAEMTCIKRGRPLPKDSPLLNLDPFVDDRGMLRVGGRLNKADLETGVKNPLIIPGRHHVVVLLVRHYHEDVKHEGRHFTEGAIRAAGYWMTGGKCLISSIIHDCVVCRKLRGKQETQMSDLPATRLTPGPPFTYVGLDAFGPWSVVTRRTRGGQANSKRWAILFTCLTTRSIHVEVIEEMSSSSFINALLRFIAIRGKVTEFRSDRGTNFVGSTDKLGVDAINVEDGQLKTFLYNKGTKWVFNPPHSSHMGGVWERMIGVTRRIFDSMMMDAESKHMTHEVLCTFMAEVSAIVNARPIVPVSSDPQCADILTPSVLLTQKTDQVQSTF